MNTKILDWLMDNADAPIRYRISREFLKDEKLIQKKEKELFENTTVQLWLKNLKPENPPQHRSMEHGCFDFCLENSLPKIVQLGLRNSQIKNALTFYIDKAKKQPLIKPYRNNWNLTFIASLLTLAEIEDDFINKIMLDNLDELYEFVKLNTYDIYIADKEKIELKGVPKQWRDKNFIKPQLLNKYGMCYPLIYDIISLHRLYGNSGRDKKIDSVIDYITTDEFHKKIADGYGILIMGNYDSRNAKYHGMGWDPKYPGWFDPADYMENENPSKLLFFAQFISFYRSAVKSRWFAELLNYLDKYKTDKDTYIFPKIWLRETPGYAVQGHHISFGENRRKKNWAEIESTFYMQLLRKNI